jgi:hypothetical protein
LSFWLLHNLELRLLPVQAFPYELLSITGIPLVYLSTKEWKPLVMEAHKQRGTPSINGILFAKTVPIERFETLLKQIDCC